MKKRIILFIFIIIVALSGIYFFLFNTVSQTQRNLQNEKGITISAKTIVKEFQINEAAANAKYLNKAVEVNGEIAEVKTDQTGNFTITLKSDDAFANVFCTLKAGSMQPKAGTTITVKGICTGFLSDVVLNEAVTTNQ